MVRVRGFAAETRVFDTEVAEGPSGGGVGGEVNLPPGRGVLNTPTEGRRILGPFWDDFGIILGSFWDHFGVRADPTVLQFEAITIWVR